MYIVHVYFFISNHNYKSPDMQYIKELTTCLKLHFYDPYIFATLLMFQQNS